MATMNNPAMLVDQSLCVGCEACTTVCKAVYGVSSGIFRTKIDREDVGSYPAVNINYNKRACMHCEEAACIMACPTGACQKSPEGLTVIDDRLCINCNYCVSNCPYGAIQYDRSESAMEKCTFCATRLREGLQPLCAEVCTSRVIKFGDRSEMISMARDRADDLRQQGYENASVYGEADLGGLRVISVLSDSPEMYGLPKDPQISFGLRLWNAVPLTPAVLVAGGLVLGANYLHTRFMQRRKDLARRPDGELDDEGGDAS